MLYDNKYKEPHKKLETEGLPFDHPGLGLRMDAKEETKRFWSETTGLPIAAWR
jgi:hypothetical protein